MKQQVGYCTNVHAGVTLAQTRANLQTHALAVRTLCSPDHPMGVGLWLSAETARDLLGGDELDSFRDWLAMEQLVPFTLNGFPYGDFHQPIVKQRVYEPTWWDAKRRDYTLNLITILDRILPTSLEGSISTLPIAWGNPSAEPEQLAAAADNLRSIAERLRQLEDETGRLIYVCIEPEPGCILDRSEDIVQFFDEHLSDGADSPTIRRYIRVCHDVCHADVMFESQQDIFRTFAEQGILVGKVQVSAAVHLLLDELAGDQKDAAVEQLASFAEDRYLHQTVVQSRATNETTFYEDLPVAFQRFRQDPAEMDRWHVHFHVPIYLERFGLLHTSQQAIRECLVAARQHSEVSHFEVETYAWSVLPDALQQETLASGIAEELTWFRQMSLRKNFPIA